MREADAGEREEGGIIGSQPFIPEPNYIVAGWLDQAILDG
jgi:hypothetical protein